MGLLGKLVLVVLSLQDSPSHHLVFMFCVVSSNTVSGLVCVTNKYGICNNMWYPKLDPRRPGSLWGSQLPCYDTLKQPYGQVFIMGNWGLLPKATWVSHLGNGSSSPNHAPVSHLNYNLLGDEEPDYLAKSLPQFKPTENMWNNKC